MIISRSFMWMLLHIHALTHWPLGDGQQFRKYYFQTHYTELSWGIRCEIALRLIPQIPAN